MLNTDPRYQVDWVVAMNSDMHVCKHMDYFVPGTFVAFKTENGGQPLDGFGTVVLRAVKAKNGSDVETADITLPRVGLLRNSFPPCNIIGLANLFGEGYKCALQHRTKKFSGDRPRGTIVERATNQRVGWVTDTPVSNKLWLEGQEEFSTSLDTSHGYLLQAVWDEEARGKFESFMTLRSQIENPPPSLPNDPPVVLSEEDRVWLRDRVGEENDVGLIEEFASSPTFAATIRRARLSDA